MPLSDFERAIKNNTNPNGEIDFSKIAETFGVPISAAKERYQDLHF